MRLRGFDNIGHTFRLPEAHVMAESAAAVAAAWQTYRGRTVTGAVMTFAGQFGDGRARSLGSDAGRATRAEDVARRSQGTASSARGRSQGTRDDHREHATAVETGTRDDRFARVYRFECASSPARGAVRVQNCGRIPLRSNDDGARDEDNRARVRLTFAPVWHDPERGRGGELPGGQDEKPRFSNPQDLFWF